MAEAVAAIHPTSTQILRPHSPIRIDWATSLSESQDSSDPARAIHRDAFTTPPQKVTRIETARTKSLSDATNSAAPSTAKKVYDFPTLMKYQTSLAGIAVFAKIKPEALAGFWMANVHNTENLFQYIGISRPIKVTTRSRGLSELSNLSRESTCSNDAPHRSFQTKFAGQPHRQPHAPPENKMLQQHTGFARFLKQHASPPHHRVTAGGRIVPAGPLSPPPMFDYASLTGMVKDRPSKTQSMASKELLNIPNLPIAERYSQTEPASATTGNPDTQKGLPLVSQSVPTMQGNLPSINTQYGSQPTTTQTLQPLASLAPMGLFEDGSIMASCNGMYYRTYWNGLGTIIEPLQITAAQSVLQNSVAFAPQGSIGATGTISTSSTFRNQLQPTPLTNATNRCRGSSEQSQVSTYSHDMDAEHSKLKATLHNLDKYLALHHYNLSQEERSTLVSHRKALVENIDAIRRSKESIKQDSSVSLKRDLARSSDSHYLTSASNKETPHCLRVDDSSTLHTSKTGTSRKPLSPAAPPFVPRSMAPPATVQTPASDLAPNSKSAQTNSNSEAQLPLGTPRNHARLLAPNSVSVADPHSHRDEQPLDQGSKDLAMRIIHPSDIEYAERYLYDRTNGEKRYCTSVSEFQEAVRRVREQARLYGCAGGSSKDPAYDAEQDIWWAICDRDPIPLPSQIPDHITNPRPWDWNDSAFNYRRASVASANIEMHSMDVRISSRFEGWAPAATQEAQTIVEIPRSSSASQGQLRQLSSSEQIVADDKSKTHPSISSIIQHSNLDELSGHLNDHECNAVQNATEVLNKRPKAIMAQSEDSSALSSHPSRPDDEKHEASRCQLALQKYTRVQEISSHSDPTALTTIAKAENSDQQPAPASLGTITPTETSHRCPLKHPFAEKCEPRNAIAMDHDQKDVPSSSTNHSLEKVPKRRSSVRKSMSSTGQSSSSNHQSGRKKPFTIYEEGGADSIASDVTKIYGEPSSVFVQPDSPRKRKRQLSPRKAAKRAKALFQKRRSKTPLSEQPQELQYESPTEPRVRLPAYTNSQVKGAGEDSSTGGLPDMLPGTCSTLNTFHANEVKSIAVTGQSNDTFLRDLLKSPRYSSSHSLTANNKKSRLKKYQFLKDNTSEAKRETAQANKENTLIEATIEGSTTDNRITTKGFTRDGLLAGKARSSLAASVYHASGYLPQYDGAGRAQTSTLHQQNGNQSSYRQARVNLPGRSSYEGRPTPLGSKSHYANRGSTSRHSDSTSLPVGLEGSSESSSRKHGSISKVDTKDSAGDKGASNTIAAIKTDRRKQHSYPNNAWHHSQVNDSSKANPEQDMEYMIVRKRQKTKTT
ncbi:MAG: hypothetical protein Q9217_005752 [Psora testacea]